MKLINSIAYTLGLGFTVLVFSACQPPPKPSVSTLTVVLNGTQQVPPVTTAGSANAELEMVAATGALRGSLTVAGFTPTNAHIHRGYAGATGAIVVTLEQDTQDASIFHIPSNTTLTGEDLGALNNGGLYLNVHSATFANGEVRGQILPEGVVIYPVTLNTAQVVPALPSKVKGSATAKITVNNTNKNIAGNILVSAMTPTGATLSAGALGTNGPLVATFTQDPNNLNLFLLPLTLLSDTDFTALVSGGMYLSVQSATYPNGQIRGQIQ